jgi:dTDP-glucose 4,6-dehydratase
LKTKVLILGGSSFAGSNFINFLSQKKKYKIIGTYNSKKNLKKLIFKNSLKKFKLIRLNLNNEKNSLLKIVKSFKPKYIFDFASVCMVNESWDDPNYYLRVNLNSKIDFIQNMHNLSFIKKFIYVGTPEIFGSTLKPVKENSLNFNPSTPYAISKLSFEQFLMAYQKNYKNKVIITRFSNFYGRGQLEHRLIPKLLKCIKNNLKFPLHGKGLTKRDFIFDEDFNNAFYKVLTKGKLGKIYHFSTNHYVSIKNIIKIICKFKKVKFQEIVYETSERKGKDKYYFLDCSKTSKELKWKPQNKLIQGLYKTIKYYDNEL